MLQHAAVVFWISTVAVALAQDPSVPHGGGTCADDWDCSLGGQCLNATCTCDAWFTGANCSYLNLAPADPANGLQVPGYYSWGGHAAFDAETQLYHGFFSFMCHHATLEDWTTKSSIVHATSAAPEGPYDFREMIVQPWAHNVYLVRDPPSGQWLIFHIGNGEVNPDQWAPCYNASESTADTGGVSPSLPTGRRSSQRRRMASKVGTHQVETGVTFVQTAMSLSGPWTPWNNNSGIAVNLSGTWDDSGGTSNPAPFIFENGTTLLFHTGSPCPPGWGLAPACIGLARAETWQGPYTELSALPIVHPESEDPSVFRDPRGNFHLLTNVNTFHHRCGPGVPCGGHAWSRDGLSWSELFIGAFGPVVRLKNGTYWTNSYVERPQVLQADDGTPLAFFVGMGRTTYVDSISWAQRFCQPGLEDCGPTIPPPPVTVQYMMDGECLVTNSTFPCPGGWADSCPVFLGNCSDPNSFWLEHFSGNLIEHAVHTGQCLNVDCVSCDAHRLVKLISCASDGDQIAYSASSAQLEFACDGGGTMCFNGGQGPAVPPCKQGEFYMPTQIQIDSCSESTTQGWKRIVSYQR